MQSEHSSSDRDQQADFSAGIDQTDVEQPSPWREQNAITDSIATTADTTEKFNAIAILANRVARGFNDGDLGTCVLTSYALAAALTDLGYDDARPVRVEAGSFPDDRKLHGVVLGGSPPRRRARDGYWWGHLVVCIGQSWLLDPTLDQINDANGTQWADAGVGVEPVAAPLTPEFWDLDLHHQVWVHFPAVRTRYTLVPQKGFARAGDARPSHWRPLAKEITRWLKQTTVAKARRHYRKSVQKASQP
jgi:hypothetical protein